MQSVLFIVLAVILYFASDRVLLWLEARAGRRFDNRSLFFFAILLALSVATFSVVRRLLG
jgi:hypothetical protein